MNCAQRVRACADPAVDKPTERRPETLYDETVLINPVIVAGERIVLHEERAKIEKRLVEGRRAVITRRVVAVRKTIEVDVLHEELHIEYLPGRGTEMLGDESDAIVVRLHAEDIEIVKHVRVVEEIVLSKRRVTETLPIAVALRHEELNALRT
jgi:uncharacterized protein (TIGR02271 family)